MFNIFFPNFLFYIEYYAYYSPTLCVALNTNTCKIFTSIDFKVLNYLTLVKTIKVVIMYCKSSISIH